MRKLFILLIACFILAVSAPAALAAKNYDLVLVHGLTNKYWWGKSFLKTCADNWGPGNVYVIYLNNDNSVWTRYVDGKKIICIGKNNYSAGDGSVEEQAQLMDKKIHILQDSHGLSSQFDIIGHSMGGLVSRRYTYLKPDTVAGLVTIATPHHGSPLATDLKWAAFFVGAENALKNLTPSWAESFNQSYPVSGSPLYNGGKVYTIRGDSDGMLWEGGLLGELVIGWQILQFGHCTDNDGGVPKASALITGAMHIADYNYDHKTIIEKSSVASKAAEYLP